MAWRVKSSQRGSFFGFLYKTFCFLKRLTIDCSVGYRKSFDPPRLLRLGRAAGMGSAFQSVQEQLSSTMANIQYSIFKIIVQLFLCNHIIACLWFLLGSGTTPEATWVQDMDMKDKPPSLQYAISLHWAFVQLGVGNTDITARNLNEFIFSIVITFLSLMNFSTMVSSMTSLLARLQKMQDEETRQFSQLRKFLAYNDIDPDLSHRITRFLQHSFESKKEAISKDGQIPILDMLSKSLQEELQLQRHTQCLRASPFLNSLLQTEDYSVKRFVGEIVTQALQRTLFALDDVVFSVGRAFFFEVSD